MFNFFKKNIFYWALSTAFILTACQPVELSEVKKSSENYLGDYVGQLSCVSCLLTTSTLHLNENGQYHLDMVMIEGENRYQLADNHGTYSKKDNIITLNEDKMYFAIVDNNQLEIVDDIGRPFPTVEGRICSLKKKTTTP